MRGAEEKAIRTLIANPRFREILRAVEMEEALSAPSNRVGSETGNAATESFAYLELAVLDSPQVETESNGKPKRAKMAA
jgi:hypothetical protein